MSDRVDCVPSRPIAGHCPMGCGQTLIVDGGGQIRCAQLTCPRPTAVDELLADPEAEHVVELGETSFILQHPLRERLDGALMWCDLHARIAARDRAPQPPGRYRLRLTVRGWLWEPIAEAVAVSHA